MKTYAERLRFSIDTRLNGNQSALAKLIGAKPQAIQYLCKQGTKSTLTNAIARALNISANWLDTGDGNIDDGQTPTHALPAPHPESNAHEAPQLGVFRPIPIVGMAQLGDNGHWSEMEYPVGFGDGYIAFPTADANAYALRCVGDSMRPRIQDGEFVIIEPNTEAIPGDEVLIKAVDGRVMVKKLLYQREGKIHVMSVNEAHPPQSFDQQEVDKLHPVTAIVKKTLWIKN